MTLFNIAQANKTIQWAPGNFSATISLCNSFFPPISISEKKPISIELHPRDHTYKDMLIPLPVPKIPVKDLHLLMIKDTLIYDFDDVMIIRTIKEQANRIGTRVTHDKVKRASKL